MLSLSQFWNTYSCTFEIFILSVIYSEPISYINLLTFFVRIGTNNRTLFTTIHIYPIEFMKIIRINKSFEKYCQEIIMDCNSKIFLHREEFCILVRPLWTDWAYIGIVFFIKNENRTPVNKNKAKHSNDTTAYKNVHSKYHRYKLTLCSRKFNIGNVDAKRQEASSEKLQAELDAQTRFTRRLW